MMMSFGNDICALKVRIGDKPDFVSRSRPRLAAWKLQERITDWFEILSSALDKKR